MSLEAVEGVCVDLWQSWAALRSSFVMTRFSSTAIAINWGESGVRLAQELARGLSGLCRSRAGRLA